MQDNGKTRDTPLNFLKDMEKLNAGIVNLEKSFEESLSKGRAFGGQEIGNLESGKYDHLD